MNCAQFELVAAGVAAGRSDAGQALRAHVAQCAACPTACKRNAA